MQKQRIVVALQEPEHVASLMKLACELAKNNQDDVIAVHVLEVGPGLPLDAGSGVLAEPARKLLAQAQQFANTQGKEIRTPLVMGRESGPDVVREAEDQNADVSILGYRQKRSHLAKVVMGSTVEYALAHAPCRVIVEAIPEAARKRLAA